MGKGKINKHSFWCIKCGRQGIPLARPTGSTREKFHKKKLYCLNCKQTINHIECRNDEEVKEFLQLYEVGEYKHEAEESEKHCRNEGNNWNV